MKKNEGFYEFYTQTRCSWPGGRFYFGGAVSKVVASLVSDIINPLLGLVLGAAEGLKTASFNVGEANVLWGSFFTVLIDFLVIALVVYFGVKSLGMDKLDKKEE